MLKNQILIYKQSQSKKRVKKKCKQCGKAFEAKRADSMYCSNSCKQKAHQQRSVEKEQTPVEPNEMQAFYLDEYQMTECEMSFITYCFARRSLVYNATIDQIKDYFNLIGNEKWTWAELNDYLTGIKAFNEFNERFHNNEFTIYPNRFTDGKDIYGVEMLS
ncbi:hypothetical protein [Emticicia sp. BO119]|uniref:hypothetical protein n=1 Tax=Emticicia sp. BO119 TaxID=2757768 RepID=UPI0015F1138C|nr:hypothetical protein [Emticicia sp. BO119]MBA4851288.1 hypothetical protein [Emticicia sp. BO119]